MHQKQFAKAETFFKELLAMRIAIFGNEDLRTVKVRQELAMLHHRQGRSDLAEPILRECLAITEKKEPDSWKTANVRSLLGASLLGQKKHAEAEPLLLEGYHGLKRHAGKPPPGDDLPMPPYLVAEAVDRIIQFYEDCGKTEEAARWRMESPPKKD